MLHNDRKFPALKVFEILSFKLCKKGGGGLKNYKINGFFLVHINDNSKLYVHAKFGVDIGSTSGSMTS